MSDLFKLYKFHRATGTVIVLGSGSRPYGPAEALAKAKEDQAAGTSRYLVSTALGAPGDRGGRWAEKPQALGLRFIGFSDEILVQRRMRRDVHNGWFLYPDGDPGEVARGAVFQLPSRKGRFRFVEALCTGEHTKGGWRDMGEKGSALIFPNCIHREAITDETNASETDAAYDAAKGADREAELFADKERNYQEAYTRGRECAELEAEAKTEREAAEVLTVELCAFEAMGHNMPAKIASTLAEAIAAHEREAEKAETKAKELRDRLGDEDAFKEGLNG